MTKKKTVHIISHSHWDREWYMAFEQHRMRLVELFDDLIELFETDPDFNSFHLDGQTIVLDDYLEVKPENRALIQKYIDAGKLKIGPFYILQDDYLISGEANTRNMLIGLEESKRWGQPVMLGYFPDTFGNMGQAPQMMLDAGIETVAFGRGVKTTGFNNVVVDEEYATQYSEMFWEGADGSKILSILFANWYSNGNEIPTDKQEAKAFWDQKLADVEKFASTSHLLMMNGVDHQPVQKDVTEAIRLANELYPDYHFIHSNFDDYMKAVKEEVEEAKIGSVKGELTSQETDGWYTLTNTASSRIYLKQFNTKVQNKLENIVEPLATLAAFTSKAYPHDKLRHAWKLLLQNHPHDSICGCSIDPVHREMMTRFEKADEVANFVGDRALGHIADAINTEKFDSETRPFTIFNTLSYKRHKVVEVEIEWERLEFNQNIPHTLYYKLEEKQVPPLTIVNAQGEEVEHEIIGSEVRFNYDLPRDRFRVPYMARYIKVRMPVTLSGYSYETYALKEVKKTAFSQDSNHDLTLENQWLKVSFKANGQVDILDKQNETKHLDFFHYEDTGDIGNEYIYRQSADQLTIDSRNFPAEYRVISSNCFEKSIEMTQKLLVPQSAEERLVKEQEAVVEMRDRQAKRSSKYTELIITTRFTLNQNSPLLEITTEFDNQVKDHRLRAIFDSGLETDHHFAESIYEVVKRPNQVSKRWQNPENPQRQQAFMNLFDGQEGMTLANKGLPEYEVLENRYVALTLIRSVREMGDWGYFPTPEAQCQGKQKLEYGVMFHDAKTRYESFKIAKSFQIPFSHVEVRAKNKGAWSPSKQWLDFESETAMTTSLKMKESSLSPILRFYNMSNEDVGSFSLNVPNTYEIYRSNLVETKKEDLKDDTIKPGEIITILFEKKVEDMQ